MGLRLAVRARLAQDAGQSQLCRGEPRGERQDAAILVLGAVEIGKLREVDLPERAPGQHLGPAAGGRRAAQDPHGRLGIGRAQFERGAPDVGKDLRVNISHRAPSYHVAGAGSAKYNGLCASRF